MTAQLHSMKDEPEYKPDEGRCILLQPLRGDKVADDIGVIAVEFPTNQERNEFWMDGGLEALVQAFTSGMPDVRFTTMTLRDDEYTPRPGETVMDL